PIRVPSLRERPEDIPLLVRHFVQQYSRRFGKSIDTIPSEATTTLARYSGPGNIRELQNVIERAVIVTTGPVLKVPSEDLRAPNNGLAATATVPVHQTIRAAAPHNNMRAALDEAERQQILAALERTSWTVAGPNGAATLLG